MKDNGYSFIVKKDDSYKKKGQFFTPHDITDFIIKIHGDNNFKKVYDPTSGYCSILMFLNSINKNAQYFGVELDEEVYEESKNRTLDLSNFNIINGDTLKDQFKEDKFDLIIANPPYGVKYKKDDYKDDYKYLPRANDSLILFFQHIIEKLDENGIAYVISSASPLFSGDAGSDESEFRKFIFEEDLVEEIYQLPGGIFYDTNITTYLWKINKNKNKNQKIKLINASNCFVKCKKNINKKNKEMDFDKLKYSEIKEIDKDFLFYNKVKIKFTEKNEDGKFETDNEIIEYSSNKEQNEEFIQSYLKKFIERDYIVLDKKVGVEISFNKIFYDDNTEVLCSIDEIRKDLEESNALLVELMKSHKKITSIIVAKK